MNSIETHVVTRGISKELCHALSMSPVSSDQAISYQVACDQHDCYSRLLSSILQSSDDPRLHHIDASDEYPDCVFIEDTVIATLDKVLITQPGAVSRRGETLAVKQFFESRKTATVVQCMSEIDPEATIDGGDVLCIEFARLILVGQSSRTNQRGIQVLRNVFPDFKVVVIQVNRGLHLKSFCSLFVCLSSHPSDTVVLVSGCDIGRDIGRQIEQSVSGIKLVFVGDVESSNCLFIPLQVEEPSKGNYRASKFAIVRKKGYPTSDFAFQQLMEEYGQSERGSIYEIMYDELAKVDGALTCCSVIYLQRS